MRSRCLLRRIQLFVQNSFAGGFISDSAAFVAQRCQECPLGAYVKLDIYPGTRYKHCRACPRGKCTRLSCYGVLKYLLELHSKSSYYVVSVKTSSIFSIEYAQETSNRSLLHTLLR